MRSPGNQSALCSWSAAIGWRSAAPWLWSAALVCSLAIAFPASADEPADDKQPAGDVSVRLASEQAQVGDRFRDLEKVLIRMAELTAHTDPRRASLLRQAISQAKERELDQKFDGLVDLLKQDRLSAGVKSQEELQGDLQRLLDLLLSEDRGKRLESEKQRIREYLRRLNQIIKEQKGLEGETSGGDEKPDKLSDRQAGLGDRTGKLGQDIARNEGPAAPKPDAKQPDAGKPGDEKSKPADGADKAQPPGKESTPNKNPGDKSQGDDKSGKPGDPKSPDKSDSDKSGSEKSDADKGDGKKSDGASKPGDDKQGKPGDGKPDGKPSDGKSDGKPSDGKPSDGKPQPGQSGSGESGSQSPDPQDNQPPAQKRLREAQDRMQEAQRQLDDAKRQGAAEEQRKAIEALEQAKAELEAILRQLREEERSRVLAQLESRFRKMLDMQIQVHEGTKRLDRVPEPDRDRDHEIESGRLSGKEAEIVNEAERALSVLREEGSSVAMPEAVGEMRDDMEQIVVRLAQSKVGEVTQKIEQDVIAALEELIAALKKAQKDLSDKKPQPGQPGEMPEPPLVDKIAELKVIRAMQMRVNNRTQRYYEIIKAEQAAQPDLISALKKLAEREERIHRVTRDIVVGRTE